MGGLDIVVAIGTLFIGLLGWGYGHTISAKLDNADKARDKNAERLEGLIKETADALKQCELDVEHRVTALDGRLVAVERDIKHLRNQT